MNKSPYSKLFERHLWLAHLLVHVVKRILGIVVEWIDTYAKPELKKLD